MPPAGSTPSPSPSLSPSLPPAARRPRPDTRASPRSRGRVSNTSPGMRSVRSPSRCRPGMPLEKAGFGVNAPGPRPRPRPRCRCPLLPPPPPPSHHAGLAPFAAPLIHCIIADAPPSLPGSDSTEHDARGGRGLAPSSPASHDPRAHSPPPRCRCLPRPQPLPP